MPLLSVNLDDPADCRAGIQLIRQRLQAIKSGLVPEANVQPRGLGHAGRQGGNRAACDNDLAGSGRAELPLRKKLERIQQRGVWVHLVAMAKLDDTPKSLPEWDAKLELPRNKMRSLKAIFAKLENRWDLRLMRVAEDAGVDESGNPRYFMPPRIRKQILSLAANAA